MSLRLAIEPSAGPHVPGEQVRGHVTVEGGEGIRALDVWLAHVEWTSDFTATARTEDIRSLATGPVHDGRQIPFELSLPLDAPPEVQSNHGGLAWEVQVKADVRGPDVIEGKRISVQDEQS